MTRPGAAGRRIPFLLVPAAIAGILLTGCAGPTELSRETAGQLQGGVVAVAESAANGDPAGALLRLDELQAELATAIADGGVSEQRAAGIQAAIDAVRADLQQAAAPVTEPEPEPAAPVEPAAPAGDEGTENDNSGPGNNNGNDNGNGKDKGKGKG